jgi:DNA-binding transcriptional LysR family regulator
VLDQLIDHGADIAVMAKMTSDPRIYSMKLREDRLVLFVRQAHPRGAPAPTANRRSCRPQHRHP